MRRPLVVLAPLLAVLLTTACATPHPAGLSEVIDRPAERALLAGMRAYEDGSYAAAERELNSALAARLASRRDRAAAHKLLAFLYCTSDRPTECEQAFRLARLDDPGFALSRAEAGHPVWGPVYRRVSGAAPGHGDNPPR